MANQSEKYILNRSIHLGLIRQSLGAGTVIEKKHDGDTDVLIIEGKKYTEVRDLIALHKLNAVVPFSEKALEEIKQKAESTAVKPIPQTKKEEDNKNQRHMKVVHSDEDLMDKDIDISHTKPKKVEARDKNAPLEVIKGDETVEEKVDRLQRSIPKMPVVEGDEAYGVDDKKPALNAGLIKVLSPEQHEKNRQEALLKAAAKVEPTVITEKRGRGRPKGSTNKSKPVIEAQG